MVSKYPEFLIDFRTWIEKADQAEAMLRSSGYRVPAGNRIAQHRALLQEFVDRPGDTFSIPANCSPAVHSAMLDLSQLATIFSHISPKDSRWRQKFQELLSGDARTDLDRSHKGRPSQCELHFAATYRRARIPIEPPQSPCQHVDFFIRVRNWRVGVETKRVTSENALRENCRTAGNQIKKARAPGLIALDITSILVRRYHGFVANSTDDATQVFDCFLEEIWRQNIAGIIRDIDIEHVAGVVIYCAMFYYSDTSRQFGVAAGVNTKPLCSRQDPRWAKLQWMQHQLCRADRQAPILPAIRDLNKSTRTRP